MMDLRGMGRASEVLVSICVEVVVDVQMTTTKWWKR